MTSCTTLAALRHSDYPAVSRLQSRYQVCSMPQFSSALLAQTVIIASQALPGALQQRWLWEELHK